MNLTLTQRIEIYTTLKNELSIIVNPLVVLRNKSFDESIINLFGGGYISSEFLIKHYNKYSGYLINTFAKTYSTYEVYSLIKDLESQGEADIVKSILKQNPIFIKYISNGMNYLDDMQATIEKFGFGIEYLSSDILELAKGNNPYEFFQQLVQAQNIHTELQDEVPQTTTSQSIHKKKNKI